MAIQIAATRQVLADAYKTVGTFIGVTTGAPGSTSTPANEASGGGYARVATTWSSSVGGVVNGTSTTVTVGAATYTHVILCSSGSGANMVDWTDTTDVVMSGAGTLAITPTYTQT